MRRVYDDSRYETVREMISDILRNISPRSVSEYDYGTYRAQVNKIANRVKDEMIYYGEPIKYGRNDHAHGIGNNNAIEIIVDNGCEEQICGLLHLTNNMYGSVICWVSDIDGKRTSDSITIRGCK